MPCCVVQCGGKLSCCEVRSDGIITSSQSALNGIKCHAEDAEDEQRNAAAADPQSPTQSMLLSADAQAEQQLHSNGNMSPQQLQEAQEQHEEAHMQATKRHMFCDGALGKVTLVSCAQIANAFCNVPASMHDPVASLL